MQNRTGAALRHHLHEQAQHLANLTAQIERKHQRIGEREALLERIQNGRVMRLLRLHGYIEVAKPWHIFF